MKHMNSALFSTLLFALLLGNFPVLGEAQDFPMPIPKMDKKSMTISMLTIEPTIKAIFTKPRSGMLVTSFLMNPMFADDFKNELGLSDEQVEKIKADFMASAKKTGPAIGAAIERINGLTDAELDSFVPTDEERQSLDVAFAELFDGMNDAGIGALTEEQRTKMDEMAIPMMGGIDSPFIDFSDSPVLGLSEEQKKQCKQLADDRKAVLDEIVAFGKNAVKSGKMNPKEMKAFQEKINVFSLKHKIRMAEILTEDQLAKAREMMKNKPKFLAKFDGKVGMPGLPDWMPDLNSWKPGDPVPDGFSEEKPKQGRFPRSL